MEEIVTAKEADLPRILEIYDIAKAYMRANGNPNQWNGAYPDPETLRTDIEKQRLYVYKKAGNIHGVFMLLLEEEPTYAYIEDGSWREEIMLPSSVSAAVPSVTEVYLRVRQS